MPTESILILADTHWFNEFFLKKYWRSYPCEIMKSDSRKCKITIYKDMLITASNLWIWDLNRLNNGIKLTRTCGQSWGNCPMRAFSVLDGRSLRKWIYMELGRECKCLWRLNLAEEITIPVGLEATPTSKNVKN